MIPAVEQQLPCRTAPELFHAPDGRDYDANAKHARESQAKSLCWSCPVVRECRRYARDTRQPHGIWGGETADERRRAISAAKAQKPGPAQAPRVNTEPVARDIARRFGARIVRLAADGRSFSLIATALRRPTADVRRAHELVTSGQIKPLPEKSTLAAA